MALASTLYRVTLELSDIDRGVYELLELRVACHPSEDLERMVVRILSRAIFHEERVEFGRGLSNAEDAAMWTRALGAAQEQVETWIDVGLPSAERLHRASKRADRVAVVTHKHDAPLKREWSSRAIHQSDKIEIVRLPAALVRELAATMTRNLHWYVTIHDGTIGVAQGDASYDGPLIRHSLAEFLASSKSE